MKSEPNIEPLLTRVASSTVRREALGMSHDDWRGLGWCVAWSYAPMLILDSLSIFGISIDAPRSLFYVKVVSWFVPIVVAIAFLVRRIQRGSPQEEPTPQWLASSRPPVKTRELVYLSRTFVTLAMLYIPMHLASSGLVYFGDYLIGKRAEPVITATEKYMAVHGSLPPNVNALFPGFLSVVPYDIASVDFSKPMTINGYRSKCWYVSVSLSRGFLQSPRWLVYCSSGIDRIPDRRSVSCGAWTRCTGN